MMDDKKNFNQRVVDENNSSFSSDLPIVENEISMKLNLPKPYPFNNNAFIIFHNGRFFKLSDEKREDGPQTHTSAYAKLYKKTFALENIGSPGDFEELYFNDNSDLVKKIKNEFIDKSLSAKSDDSQKRKIVKNKLVQIIDEVYSDFRKEKCNPDQMQNNQNYSEFEQLKGYNNVAVVDGKLYSLVTIKQYISTFQEAFESEFYKQLQRISDSETPENISKIIQENSSKVHDKVLPLIIGKIWHSSRSCKIFIDGRYYIPEYRESIDEMVNSYSVLIERKIKLEAAVEYSEFGFEKNDE